MSDVLWATKIYATPSSNILTKIDSSNDVFLFGGSPSQVIRFFDGAKPIDNIIDNTNGYNMTGTNSLEGEVVAILVKYSGLIGDIQWATKIGTDSTIFDTAIDLKIDTSKDVFVCGNIFSRTNNRFYDGKSPSDGYFDLGEGYNTNIEDSESDTFFVKYDGKNGNIIWLTEVTGITKQQDYPTNITLDRFNNSFLTGYSNGTDSIKFYDGVGPSSGDSTIDLGQGYSVTGGDQYIAFLSKYNGVGKVQWVSKINNLGASESRPVNTISDKNDDIYVNGSSDTITVINFYDGSEPVGTTIPIDTFYTMTGDSGPGRFTWLVKYSGETGGVQWATKIGGTSGDKIPINLRLDTSNDVFISGSCIRIATTQDNNNIRFYDGFNPVNGVIDNGDSNSMLIGYNEFGPSICIWLSKYGGENGKLEWATKLVNEGNYRFGFDNGNGELIDMVMDNKNNVYLNGYSNITVEGDSSIKFYNSGKPIDNQISNDLALSFTIEGISDIWLVKYDGETGEIQWATKISGSGIDTSYKTQNTSTIQVDYDDNVYITAFSNSTSITFYDGIASGDLGTGYNMTESSGNFYTFISKYDGKNGKLLWATKISSDNDFSRNIQIDSTNKVYISGLSSGAPGSQSYDIYNAVKPTNNSIILDDPNIMDTVIPSFYLAKYNGERNIPPTPTPSNQIYVAPVYYPSGTVYQYGSLTTFVPRR